jgi:lysophospholipase L1-like esterase
MKYLFLLLLASCGSRALVVGDSLAADRPTMDIQGWGTYLKLDGVNVINKAVGGKSSKSFYDGYWRDAYDGSYVKTVFLMFGANDIKPEEHRHTDPQTTYKEYLNKYIDEVTNDGREIVLITTLEYTYHNGCTSTHYLGDYAQAMREVAADRKVKLIDMNALIVSIMEADCFGAETVKLHAVNDPAHLSPYGAKFFAKRIAEEYLK